MTKTKVPADKCTRCRGKGLIDTPVLHLGVPGLCYACDGKGTRAAQAANRERDRKIKAHHEACLKVYDACWKIREEFGELDYRMSRSMRDAMWSVAKSLPPSDEYPVFTTDEFAEMFGLTRREAFNTLCQMIPAVSTKVDAETLQPVGWALCR